MPVRLAERTRLKERETKPGLHGINEGILTTGPGDFIKELFLKSPKQDWFQSFKNNDNSLFVLGAGLMRTGTTSLKRALEMLYGRPCYHMSEVFYRHKESHIEIWRRLLQRPRDRESHMSQMLWQKVYKNYCAAVDYPTCVFYEELMNVYPNAKIILTYRDPDEWVGSCRGTTLCEQMIRKPTIGERVIYWMRGLRGLPELHDQMFTCTLGQTYSQMSDTALRDAYIQWNTTVIETVPAGRLLVFKPEEGWKPLCDFLNLPQPPEGTAYPKLNTRGQMKKSLSQLFNQGQLVDTIIIFLSASVLLAVFLFIFHRHF